MLLVNFTTNKTYGTFFTKLPPNHYQYKAGSIRKIQQNGINYELDLSDIMDWYVYFGFKDPARLKLHSLVKKDDVVFDVGANIGATTLNFAKLTGEDGKVHSFEPDPINYYSIQKNIKLNNFKNIVLNKIGLGNNEGTFNIYTIDKNNKGMNKIVNGDNNNNPDFQKIQVTTIDHYIQKNKIQKIDVEGFELNVIKGSYEVLNKFHPDLFIELDNQNLIDQNTSAKELVKYLINIGYTLFHAETNIKIDLEYNFSMCHFDIVAKYQT